MAKKHPCNCHQMAAKMNKPVPPIGAIRQALGALGPSPVGATPPSMAGFTQLSTMLAPAVPQSGVDLDDLLELVRSNPGLKITLSYDTAAPQAAQPLQFG